MYKISHRYGGSNQSLRSKIMLIMRLTTVILIASLMQVSASTFGQQITISRKNASLESLLKEIRSQSSYDFFYDGKILPKKLLDVSIKDVDINEALNKVLAGSSLSYTIEGKIVTIKKQSEPILINRIVSGFELIDVRGKVTDENGKPLAGATVFVEDSKIKANTNEKGEFYLKNVSDNATIYITFIGYKPVELMAARDLGTVQMTVLTGNLDEIEVEFNTGYEQISRDRAAGSFAKPNLNVMLNRTTSTNILDRLEGLVPGLSSGSGGQDGGMVIRGSTSINVATNPLVVVDGIQVQSIENVNMQDVQDITVLKDATSASIWGAKAANGVIVITTKKGKIGDKLKIDYDGYYAFNGRVKRDYLPVFSTRDFINSQQEIFPLEAAGTTYAAASANGLEPHKQILWDQQRGLLTAVQAQSKLDSLSKIDNWSQLDNFFVRDAAQLNQTISASGGGKTHSFYASLNHVGTISNTPGEKNNQYKINLRNDLTLGKRVKVYVDADLTNIVTSSIGSGGGNAPRYQLYEDANGNPLNINYIAPWGDAVMPSETNRLDFQARSRINLDYNPLLEFDRQHQRTNLMAARLVGGGTIDIIEGLKFIGTYGYNIASTNDRTVLDESNWEVRRDLMRYTVAATPEAIPVYNLPQFGGRLNTENSLNTGWTIRNQMSYNKEWSKHSLSLMAGQEATSSQTIDNTSVYYGWDDQLQISHPVDFERLSHSMNGVSGPTGVLPYNLGGGEGRVSRTTSYFATAGYTYASKYTLNASWRIDQSNLFGLDKSAQNRPVYSIGAKWALGREGFVENITALNRLDVRFSYGITGNAPNVGQAASFDIFTAEDDPNVSGPGLILSVPANDKLTWEETKVYNAGIDFGLFNNRLNGSIDAYLKNTSDLIGALFTSPLTGYSSVTGNFGDLQNKGIDLSLNSINLRTDNFQWNTSLVLGYNKNKLTKLNISPPTTGSSMVGYFGTNMLVGRPLHLLFTYDYAGLNADGNPQVRRANGSLTSSPNETLPEDIVYSGLTQAPWNGGLANNFQYKNFNLGINIVYSLGYKMRDPLNGTNSENPEFNDRWKQPGDENRTDIPKYVYLASENALRDLDYYTNANTRILDASYAKIRDISLGYTVPQLFARKINAQAITFRINISNLLIWTANDKFYDPENGSSRSRVAQGTVSLGAHVTF